MRHIAFTTEVFNPSLLQWNRAPEVAGHCTRQLPVAHYYTREHSTLIVFAVR
jgi:hypothetical protein